MPVTTKQPPWANRITGHGTEAPDQLLANPHNWRVHPAYQQEALTGVLEQVGLVQQVVVNKTTGHLVDGHLRAALAVRAGQPTLPVVYVELSRAEEALVLATLDPVAALALPDGEKVRELLEIAGSENQAVLALLEDLARQAHLVGLPVSEETQPVPAPPENPVSKLGDLYLLGEHRLLCGDSTKPEDVTRLMAGERAELMVTDPPYLVDYTGGLHPSASQASKHKWDKDWQSSTSTKDKRWDDYVDHDTSVNFYVDFLKVALEQALIEAVPIYQCHGIMRSDIVLEAWRQVGLLSHQILIWRKSRPVLTHAHYMWDFEPFMYGWPKGSQPASRPPADAKTVWEIDSKIEDGAGSVHPTMKPLELFRRPIAYHTNPGQIIFEPFSGSGTAILAAEQTGRICYALELSPAYVDVAVQRWQNLTGQQACRE